MVRVSKLHEKTMRGSFTWYGEKINFEYKPGARRTGTGYFQDLQDGINDGEPNKVIEAVAKFLVSWDLEIKVGELKEAGYYDEKRDDDGEVLREAIKPPKDDEELVMVPTDIYGLLAADLPQTIYGAMQDAVNEDVQSGGKNTKKAR